MATTAQRNSKRGAIVRAMSIQGLFTVVDPMRITSATETQCRKTIRLMVRRGLVEETGARKTEVHGVREVYRVRNRDEFYRSEVVTGKHIMVRDKIWDAMDRLGTFQKLEVARMAGAAPSYVTQVANEMERDGQIERVGEKWRAIWKED